MDITQFINSRDIREHLKNIGYEFTSLEAAWLIGDCSSITLEEKHASWHAILMDEYAKSVAPEHFTDEGMRLVGLK